MGTLWGPYGDPTERIRQKNYFKKRRRAAKIIFRTLQRAKSPKLGKPAVKTSRGNVQFGVGFGGQKLRRRGRQNWGPKMAEGRGQIPQKLAPKWSDRKLRQRRNDAGSAVMAPAAP